MTASRTIAALGSLLVLGSFFGAATTRGVGSAIDGRELADLLLSGTVTAWIPRWVGATLYLVPLAGALGLVSVGLDGRPARVLFALAATVAATVVAILAWALDGETVRSPGSGSLLVFAGIGAWALAVAVGLRQRRASE